MVGYRVGFWNWMWVIRLFVFNFDDRGFDY